MPFPWKKVKTARISQLVNDHLHISQKRRDGSSLVVETGFPTSLIDLFFKNREKLKKPSKKKRRGLPIAPSDDVYDRSIVESAISFPSPPPPPPPPLPPPSLVGSPMPLRHSSVLPPPPSCVDEIHVAGSSGSDGGVAAEEHRRTGGGDGNGVLLGVLKVFVVVVLALATKRLTAGITISAMLLLLLEYVGKHCRLLSPPCAAAASVARRCFRLLRCKKSEPHQQQERSLGSRFSDQEIQAIETTAYSTAGVDEIQPEKETRDRLGHQETELLEMAMKREESNRKSNKARIKSKMQKIVPKKFRRSRKVQESQTPAVIKDDEEEEESELGSISSSSSVSNATSKEEFRLSDVNEEAAATEISDKGATEAALARTYMFLCLIVLVGLIGGRLFALVLTLSWLLLVKLGQKLLPRSIK